MKKTPVKKGSIKNDKIPFGTELPKTTIERLNRIKSGTGIPLCRIVDMAINQGVDTLIAFGDY